MIIVSNIFGEAEPIFGGARLPIDLEMITRDCGLCHEMLEVGRVDRLAVGTMVVLPFDVNLLPQLGTRHTLGERLGTRVSFDRMHGRHSSWVSGKRFDRAGASPHQSSAVASPYRSGNRSTLMTKIKTFVTYLKYPVVPL
jgi:hypothetical protein